MKPAIVAASGIERPQNSNKIFALPVPAFICEQSRWPRRGKSHLADRVRVGRGAVEVFREVPPADQGAEVCWNQSAWLKLQSARAIQQCLVVAIPKRKNTLVQPDDFDSVPRAVTFERASPRNSHRALRIGEMNQSVWASH